MKKSENISEIAKALNEVRKNIKQPEKNANNPFFKSKYVMLEGVVDAIDKALPKGFAYTQEVTSDGNQISVSTFLMHESGQYIQFDPLNVPVGKNDAQAFGSAETYARRYTLSAVFGVTSDVDDDGNSATKSAPKEAPHKRRDAPKKSSKPMASQEDKDTLKDKIAALSKEMAMEPKPLTVASMKNAKVTSWKEMTKDDLSAMDHELTTELMEFRQKSEKKDSKKPADESTDELWDKLNV
ncbi:ERF superfamily protein [Lentilactobacillus parabuchneri]|uniref:ERF superfamily protein n=1 Tax=Lentilactobacillus parabuchneri TaxID=152331 RepID=A0A1X1FCJ2_9LACO|nr:ERF family protein [Lentilactobacillus parabuchneri]APR08303.1 ERF superfamily protein [Lentilactobacillus parabuchneri]ORN02892.1 ERF superfamily protein [Lentilactobacillus parabuchneri]ORN06481.1 ERF superfamily protein [Lentilactobacillus parabuchneri]ORN26189.1 ERF superfamily protein [Lentilactobacillus parabuchneri]TLQ32221.1 single-stranded DNA-binding protein [Lentilactobacillus parabuchneri]